MYKRQGLRRKIKADDFAHVVAASCLAHDIGNPPLGHSGESAICYYFSNDGSKGLEIIASKDKWLETQKADFTNFEGNAMGFRILTHSSQFESALTGGMGLTYATLAAYSKYPMEAHNEKNKDNKTVRGKFGFFQADKDHFNEIADEVGLVKQPNYPYARWCRHPLAFLSEAADEICYLIMDLEDGCKEKIFSFNETETILKEICQNDFHTNKYESIWDVDSKIKYLRAKAINHLILEVSNLFIEKQKDLLNGTYNDNLLKVVPTKDTLAKLKTLEIDKLYQNLEVLKIEASGFEVLPGLLDAFIRALIYPESEKSEKIIALIPKQYLGRDGKPFKNQYENFLGIVQYVASMTDTFAIDTYRLLKGISISGY